MPIGSALGLVAIPLCNNNKGSALGPAAIPLWNNNKEYRGALAQTTGPCNNLWRRGSLYTQAFPRQWPRCVGLIGARSLQLSQDKALVFFLKRSNRSLWLHVMDPPCSSLREAKHGACYGPGTNRQYKTTKNNKNKKKNKKKNILFKEKTPPRPRPRPRHV